MAIDTAASSTPDMPWVVILADAARGLGPILQVAHALTAPARVLVVFSQEGDTRLPGSPIPPANLCVQPRNRGTATGLLLAATHIEQHEPEASVVVLPAEHAAALPEVIVAAVARAQRALHLPDRASVLLGVIPDDDHAEHGWIVPGPRCGDGPTLRIRHLVPARSSGRRPAEPSLADAVWNTGLLVTTVSGLIGLYAHALPRALAAFHRDPALWDDWRPWVREAIYDVFPTLDLRTDLLEPCAPLLRLLPVPACGWRATRALADALGDRTPATRALAP